jgi:CHAT domain-containing protein/tetratricopeptide (TPR) repeat protein
LTIFGKLGRTDHPDAAEQRWRLADINQLERLGEQQLRLVQEATEVLYKAEELAEAGKKKEAVAAAQKGSELRRKVLGAGHLDTATALYQLGCLLDDLDRYRDAAPVLDDAITAYRQSLGEHPRTATALLRRASVASSLNDHATARPRAEEAVAIRQKTLGEEDRSTATAIYRLARVLSDQGNAAEARTAHEQALRIRRKALGDHETTLDSLNALAFLLKRQGELALAQAHYEEALQMRSRLSGDWNPKTADALTGVGRVLVDLGLYVEARRHLEQALSIRRNQLGAQHPKTADSLQDLANLASSENEYDTARSLYKQALAILRQNPGPGHPDTLRCVHSLGWVMMHLGDFRAARSCFEEELTGLRKVKGEEWAVAYGHAALGEVCNSEGDQAGAQHCFEQAVASAEAAAGKDSPIMAPMLESIAELQSEQWNYEAARSLLERSLAIHTKTASYSPDTATTLIKLGRVRRNLGDHPGARDDFEKALAILTRVYGAGDPGTNPALAALGALKATQGDVPAARHYYEQMLAQSRKKWGEDSDKVVGALNQLSSLLLDQGDYANARAYAQRTWMITRKASGANHPFTVSALYKLAIISRADGDGPAARSYYEQALAACRTVHGEENPNTAKAMAELGVQLRNEKDYAAARRHFEQALAIYERTDGPESVSAGNLQLSLGQIMLELSELAAAQQHFERALAIFRHARGEENKLVAKALMFLGTLELRRGDYRAALARFERVAVMKGRSDDAESQTRLALWLVQCHVLLGDDAAAQRLLAEAFARQLKDIPAFVATLSESEALGYLARANLLRDPLLSVQMRLAPKDARTAYEVVWASRGLVSRALANRRPPVNADADVKELWQQLRDKRAQLAEMSLTAAAPYRLEPRRRRIVQLTAEKEKLERQLAERSASFRTQRQEGGFEALARMLPLNAAVVDIVQMNYLEPDSARTDRKRTREYLAFVLRRSDASSGCTLAWVRLGPCAPIDNAIKSWGQRLLHGESAPIDEAPELILRRLLWEPIEAHLDGCAAVIAIPDGDLTRLPWAALPGKRPGRVLLEEYALSVASHGRQLLETYCRPALQGQDLLVVGGVQYDAAAAPSVAVASHRGPARGSGAAPVWANLPGTAAEVERIRALWANAGPATFLEGGAAGKPALAVALPRASYVHLATHGFFADAELRSAFQLNDTQERVAKSAVLIRNPLVLSGVVLAGANRQPQVNSDGVPVQDNGILTAEEVVELDLSHTELVVLSACETGLGEVAGGEGVFGLQRAFGMAGAHSTVASLWKVDDAATQKLMTRFYENLWQKKLPKLEALRQAQLSILYDLPEGSLTRGAEVVRANRADTSTVRADPRLWAAWVLSGDPGDLSQVQPVARASVGPAVASATGERVLLVFVAAYLVATLAFVFLAHRSRPSKE